MSRNVDLSLAAEYAAKYAELTSLRSELLRVWLECEAIQ
jgi:hypothetical protein